MARSKPSQSPDLPDDPASVATLPAAGGSYAAGGDGVLQQTEGLIDASAATRRGFGRPQSAGSATPTDTPTEA